MSERNYDVFETSGVPVKSWTRGVPFEHKAREQVRMVAELPFVHKHVAIMPDVHYGIGATVGSVIATKGAVIPAAVGVDIGCGMIAAKTTLRASDLPDSMDGVYSAICKAVPHGSSPGRVDRGSWGNVPESVGKRWKRLEAGAKRYAEHQGMKPHRAANQLGTLGGGNHFIEVCLDEADGVWVMLHSGSRGVGNSIGSHYITRAQSEMRRHFINLPDKNLAYISEGSELFDEYVGAVEWAQDYAMENRRIMMEATLDAMRSAGLPVFAIDGEAVACHHNYVSRERHFGSDVIVTRKGAVNAESGRLGIIPGSMGAKSFIVRGKGNSDSFNSCSHGAGRVMSRSEAKKRFTVDDHVAATAGVTCRKDESVLDETPAAYKDIESVMRAQEDLVEVVATLKQICCVKG